MFIQFLSNSFISPQTVKNYLSGAKNYALERGWNYIPFTSSMIRNMVRGVERLSKHSVSQAPALTVPFIKRMCDSFRKMGLLGHVIASMILFVFASYVRQSNVAFTPDGFIHMIKRNDVRFSNNHMWITIHSTKTISPTQGVVIPIRKTSSKYCPVAAYIYVLGITPTSYNTDLFLDPLNMTPLHAVKVNMLMRAVATSLGHPLAKAISLHSLRRSAALACASLGISELEIKEHGTWKSGAVYSYVPKIIFTKVPGAVANLLQ